MAKRLLHHETQSVGHDVSGAPAECSASQPGVEPFQPVDDALPSILPFDQRASRATELQPPCPIG